MSREQMTKKRVTPSMNTPQMTLTPTTEPHNDMGQDMNCDATLPIDIQRHLGNLLKASYNDILTAPIPDRFLNLLHQLESMPGGLESNNYHNNNSFNKVEGAEHSSLMTDTLTQKKGC